MESITVQRVMHPEEVRYLDGLTAELKELKEARVTLVGDERAENVRRCCGLILRINVALGKLKD